MPTYRHTQIGFVTTAALAVACLLVGYRIWHAGTAAPHLVVALTGATRLSGDIPNNDHRDKRRNVVLMVWSGIDSEGCSASNTNKLYCTDNIIMVA